MGAWGPEKQDGHGNAPARQDATNQPAMSMHPARQAYVEEEHGAVRRRNTLQQRQAVRGRVEADFIHLERCHGGH